ncbi:MAG TPA: DUF2330 domain-containing protein [Acidimicrobiales bacterium]
MRARLAIASAVTALTVLATAVPAVACGGLVGENGTIQLERTTTLAAYHDGVEHYVTSFQFSGEGQAVGSIIPLPGVPSVVERGGDWTLQRLEREVAPPVSNQFAAAEATAAPRSDATVLYQTTIDALDITILQGGGTEVGKWAIDNGFLLTPDAPEVLDYYSQRSPIFMAARFDAAAAEARGQDSGDGTPIELTIPTDRPWVPLRILGLGLDADRPVQADVFLLTDNRPQLLAGSHGLELKRSEPANQQLLDDLRSDKNMDWVPSSEWFTYLAVNAKAGDLKYDLATSVDSSQRPMARDAGFTTHDLSLGRAPVPVPDPSAMAWWQWPVAVLMVGVAAIGLVIVFRRRPSWWRA